MEKNLLHDLRKALSAADQGANLAWSRANQLATLISYIAERHPEATASIPEWEHLQTLANDTAEAAHALVSW